MSGLESLLRRHEQVDRMARLSNPLPVELGIWEDLLRLWEEIAACRHGYQGSTLSAERLILLAGYDQDALGVSWSLGHQDVGTHVLSRCDDVFALPPDLGELLFKVDLVVGAEEGVGPS